MTPGLLVCEVYCPNSKNSSLPPLPSLPSEIMKSICTMLLVLVALFAPTMGFIFHSTKSQLINPLQLVSYRNVHTIKSSILRMADGSNNKIEDSVEETTKKYGLEAGLFKAVTEGDKSDGEKVKPQDLLKKYCVAYLATSITLAIISYAICYVLVSNGIDVGSLLEKLGIQSSAAASNTGTAAIAYAVHKAASPIRFPPTVVLTPIVAEWLGKKPAEEIKN